MNKQKTPYIIYKPEQLVKNYKQFSSLANKHLQKPIIAYSVKTNSYKPLIFNLKKLKSHFEISSYNEMRITPKKSLIFNSPSKTKKELKIAIKNKYLINIDSKSEIDKLAVLLKNKTFPVGIRVSFNDSKFGIDTNSLEETIEYAKSKKLKIISFHFHTGTQLNLNDFEDNLIKINEVINFYYEKLRLKYINIGGGFPDKLKLKSLNLSLEDYFKLIHDYLNKFDLTIILEPGRYLVSDAFDLITRVNTIKIKNSQTYAILDAGINILSKIALAQHEFTKLNDDSTKKQDYILAGPLLFNNDILGKYKGILNEKDLIKISNVGAYCYNLAWTISYGKPRIFIQKSKNS